MHPTAITHDADLYSGDLAGIACAALEKDRAPVVGFFNGAEGDISPDWLVQDRDDAIRLAGSLAGRAATLLDGRAFRADSNPMIEVRRKIVANSWRDTDGVGFASKPMSGAAEFGGAEDGRTIFYNYGWRAEARKPAPAGEHGVKEPALDGPVASAVESLDGNSLAQAFKVVRPARFLSSAIFPALVPVTWARLSAFTLAAIPVEATTAVGWIIRQETGADAIVGLANEYIGYTASAPEYDAQQYEGASTLLGPGEAEGLARLLVLAAAGRGDQPSGDIVPAQTFLAGPRRKNAFGPETLLVRRKRNMVDEDLEPLVPRRLRRLEARIPRFDWSEDPAGDWHVDARQVAIYTNENEVWHEHDTDRGLNFLTVLSEADKFTRTYTALWLPPVSSPAPISLPRANRNRRTNLLAALHHRKNPHRRPRSPNPTGPVPHRINPLRNWSWLRYARTWHNFFSVVGQASACQSERSSDCSFFSASSSAVSASPESV